MSIVPLIIEGEYKNIVEKQTDFMVDGNKIRMLNCDIEQLNAEHEANTSYDFRIGEFYLDHRDNIPQKIEDGGSIKLKPGMAVIIQTEEFVQFPKKLFGQIVPKVGLLKRGISNTTSKIDPGYQGKLLITVFNLGKNTEDLKRNEKFCTLIVHEIVGNGIKTYDKPSTELQSARKKSFAKKVRDYLFAKEKIGSTLALIIAILAMIANWTDIFYK